MAETEKVASAIEILLTFQYYHKGKLEHVKNTRTKAYIF